MISFAILDDKVSRIGLREATLFTGFGGASVAGGGGRKILDR